MFGLNYSNQLAKECVASSNAFLRRRACSRICTMRSLLLLRQLHVDTSRKKVCYLRLNYRHRRRSHMETVGSSLPVMRNGSQFSSNGRRRECTNAQNLLKNDTNQFLPMIFRFGESNENAQDFSSLISQT